MIFSRKYDKSLWLMSLGNKKEAIVNFIARLPQDFCDDVQDSIKKYYHYLLENKNVSIEDIEKIELKGKYITSGDMFYWYSIDLATGSLTMGEGIEYDGCEYNTIWLSINPFNMEKYNKLEMLDTYLLGDISYNFIEDYVNEDLQVVDMDTTEFSLVKLPFGSCAIISSIMDSRVKNDGEIILVQKDRANLVNMRNIPNTYDTDMIGKKFARIRKRK